VSEIEIVYSSIKKEKKMYSLKCDYYKKEFNYLHELVDDVLMSGMDPDYEITKNGVGINEKVIDLIKF
jgi:hypothetical protein